MLSWLLRPESETAAQESKLTAAAQFVMALETWYNNNRNMPIYSSDYHKFFAEQKLNEVVTKESAFIDLLNVIPIVGARKCICEYIIRNCSKIITNQETLSRIGDELGFPYGSTWWKPEPDITSWIPTVAIWRFDAIYSQAAPVLTSSRASMFSTSNHLDTTKQQTTTLNTGSEQTSPVEKSTPSR